MRYAIMPCVPLLGLVVGCAAELEIPNEFDPEPPAGWDVREVARIGTVDGPAHLVFGHVIGVDIDNDGNAYVLDRLANIVRVYSPAGEYIRDIGSSRPGSGPGEMRQPGGLLISADERLLVLDHGNKRYNLFELDGTFIASYQRSVDVNAVIWNARLARNGLIYEPDRQTGGIVGAYVGWEIRDGRVVIVDTIRCVDQTPEPPYWPLVHTEATRSAGVIEVGRVRVPFSPHFRQRLDSRGIYWAGTTDSLRFTRYGAAGEVLEVIERLPHPAAPRVMAEHRNAAIRQLEDRFNVYYGPQNFDQRLMPDHMPHWDDFFVDDEDRLWVQRFRPPTLSSSEPNIWEIYDPVAGYLGALSMHVSLLQPHLPTAVKRGNRIVGALRDEDGVTYVVLYELEIRP